MTFERKLVEQSVLRAPTFPHHRFAPQSPNDQILMGTSLALVILLVIVAV
jgi:hypothetical protein